MKEYNTNSAAEKLGIAIIVLVVLVILAIFGVGIWALIEIVQWLTSK